jgi:hypothetical protein
MPDPAPAKATSAIGMGITFGENKAHSARGEGNENGSEKHMACPRFVPEVASKYWKEAEDFDAE